MAWAGFWLMVLGALLNNYAVLRGVQDFRGGESNLGFIATGVNRALDSWSSAFMCSRMRL